MGQQHYFIVGDIFEKTTSATEYVLTETKAVDLILSKNSLDSDTHFYLQQGVDTQMLVLAKQRFDTDKLSNQADFILHYGDLSPRATKRQAHKMRNENICVSNPFKISDTEYKLDLHFSSQNEFFLDHTTGMHIQGMLLVESGRQAFLTVTEEFFLKDEDKEFYFVIDDMNISFRNFVFPFDANLSYKIIRSSHKGSRYNFDVEIEILQGGYICTAMLISFTAYHDKKIFRLEKSVANNLLAKISKETFISSIPKVTTAVSHA